MLVRADRRSWGSLLYISTLLHLVNFYFSVEAFIQFTGQGLCTLLAPAAGVGNGRPNLGSVKAAITIHFISSSLLLCSYFSSVLSSAFLSLSHRLLVHHLSSSFNSLRLASSLLPPSLFFYLLYSLPLSSAQTLSPFFILHVSARSLLLYQTPLLWILSVCVCVFLICIFRSPLTCST